jgi:hypothetical protein
LESRERKKKEKSKGKSKWKWKWKEETRGKSGTLKLTKEPKEEEEGFGCQKEEDDYLEKLSTLLLFANF